MYISVIQKRLRFLIYFFLSDAVKKKNQKCFILVCLLSEVAEVQRGIRVPSLIFFPTVACLRGPSVLRSLKSP